MRMSKVPFQMRRTPQSLRKHVFLPLTFESPEGVTVWCRWGAADMVARENIDLFCGRPEPDPIHIPKPKEEPR